MQIRLATDSDESALSRIYLECRSNTFYWISENEFAVHDFKRDTEGEVVVVAVENKTILGFASIWAQDNFLHHLFVDSKYQGRRIGKSLIDHCLEGLLKRPARLKCVIRNERACPFMSDTGGKLRAQPKTVQWGLTILTFSPRRVLVTRIERFEIRLNPRCFALELTILLLLHQWRQSA